MPTQQQKNRKETKTNWNSICGVLTGIPLTTVELQHAAHKYYLKNYLKKRLEK